MAVVLRTRQGDDSGVLSMAIHREGESISAGSSECSQDELGVLLPEVVVDTWLSGNLMPAGGVSRSVPLILCGGSVLNRCTQLSKCSPQGAGK
jgi:hypothetical protein